MSARPRERRNHRKDTPDPKRSDPGSASRGEAGQAAGSSGAGSRRITLAVSALLLVGVLAALVLWPAARQAGQLEILYPFEGSLFPPEIIAPTVWWSDGDLESDSWGVTVAFDDGSPELRAEVDTTSWTPDADTWESIKAHTLDSPATITVTSRRGLLTGGLIPARASVSISTSRDSVGAPIFYRDVPLPFKFALRNVPMIRWRLGNIASPEPPPTVLDNLPVCGNCHSFSSDGGTLGMDVDLGSDKGAYAVTTFEETTVLSPDKLVSWSDYVRGNPVPTFGMLPRVSPDGRHVLAGVKDRAVFLPREDLLFSQIFFPVKGILAYLDRSTGEIHALPGADDETLVQSNGVWSPDGEYVYFARGQAAQLENGGQTEDILLTLEEAAEVLGGEEHLHQAQEGGKRFRFNLYRVPFNDGAGGVPEPIPGASENGMSNYFPKPSPDGKWLVFTQAHSFMLLQPDSKLYIMPVEGGEPRLLNANTDRMNSWHSWSPNSKWLVFSTKVFGAFTQLMLTHIDESGNDSPPVWLQNFTALDRAVNIPEFVNIPPEATRSIREAFVDDYSYFRSGRIYEQFHEYDRAQEEFQRSLEINPENTFSLYSLATIYREEEDFQEARSAYEAILEVDPGSAIVHHDLGSLLFEMEEYEEAEAEFRTAVRLDPENIEAGFNLGTTYLMLGRLGEAERAFLRLRTLDLPDEPALRVSQQLAAIYLMANDYGRAVPELQAVIEGDAQNAAARYNLGVAYVALGHLEAALEALESAARLDPNDATIHGQLGEIAEALGDPAAALQSYHRVVDLDPRNLGGWMQLARLYYERREFDSARDAMTRILGIDPENVWARVSLGRVFYEIGDYVLAVRQFNRVLEQNPEDSRAWFLLAEALIREGRSLTEPITAYQRGLSLDPSYVDGHITLGDLYVRVGDLSRAIREFQAALELGPRDQATANDLTSRIQDLQRRIR